MKTVKVGTVVAIDVVTRKWEISASKGTREGADELMEDLQSLSEGIKDFLPDYHIFVLTADIPTEFPEVRAEVKE